MNKGILSLYARMAAQVTKGIKSVLSYKPLGHSGIRDTNPHQGQNNKSAPHSGTRRFFYIGLDDKKHSVRIGKPFSVRPKLYPNMIIATFGNRDMIRVYA